jgi:hypothetical protein
MHGLRRLAPLLVIAFLALGIPVFTVVALTADSAPALRPFKGWLAVLQHGHDLDSRVELGVRPVTPGGVGGNPKLEYHVVACGSKAFHGVFLAGGDARLSNPTATSETIHPSRGSPISERELRFSVAGAEPTELHRVQVLKVTLPASPCVTPKGIFGGPVEAMTGFAGAAVQHNSHGPFGWLNGPRSSQSWPSIGRLPGVSGAILGDFRFSGGMHGSWHRPFMRFRLDVGSLTQKALVEVARPESSSSTGLTWIRKTPFAAGARLLDIDLDNRWQHYLIAATIWMSIGASALAAMALGWVKRDRGKMSAGHLSSGAPGDATKGAKRAPSVISSLSVTDLTHVKIEEIDAIEGFDRLSMRRAAAALGVSSFGISIEEFEPGADEYPEHDHDEEGLGGKMFGERTEQLGQEEVYVALRGSGALVVDGEEYPIDSDHIVRVGPGAVRKILAGPDGLRLLALGGRPGEAYDPGGTL